MTEHQAREALLVRAFDRQSPSELWSESDRHHASQEALRRCGSDAPADVFVAERASCALRRLERRQPGLTEAVHSQQWRPWIGPILMLVALLSGLALDAAGAGQRINILNPPLLLILLWNLLTYLVLSFNALWPGKARIQSTGLSRLLMRLATGQRWREDARLGPSPATENATIGAGNTLEAALSRFRNGWHGMAAPLYAERAFGLLHTGSLLFALGALGGLYLRGLAFEYRAGWESTFLHTDQVVWLLELLWGPASFISGIELPDASRLASLRYPEHPGENAAPWIHLQMLTLLLLVILPRLVLAIVHRLRARRLAEHFPLPLEEPYFRDLSRQLRGEASIAWVMPYSYNLPADNRNGLKQLLGQSIGSDTALRLQPSLGLGEEDVLEAPLPELEGCTLAVALFSLSATPEAENHATFLQRLGQLLPASLPLVALVDESSFRARFGADSNRLDTRRAAWIRILATHSDIPPIFVSLDQPPATDTVQLLGERLSTVPAGH
ncbi:MAG: DUF2868 domain-containing protein [Lautropia sp.]|nr:DUF2868 domain-containing protein [Lautropia sp.]